MTDRREACITFQRMTRAQLPTSEYTMLRQLFQKLTSGLSNAKDVHEAICAILRRHNATELLALFERLVAMGTKETALRLLHQPFGVLTEEGAPVPPCPQTSGPRPELVCPRLRPGAGRLVQQPVVLLIEPSDRPATDTPQECVVSLVLAGLQPRTTPRTPIRNGSVRLHTPNGPQTPFPRPLPRPLSPSLPVGRGFPTAPRLTGPLTARFDAGVARFSDLRLCGPLPAGCRLSFALRGSKDVPPVQSKRLTLTSGGGGGASAAAASAASASASASAAFASASASAASAAASAVASSAASASASAFAASAFASASTSSASASAYSSAAAAASPPHSRKAVKGPPAPRFASGATASFAAFSAAAHPSPDGSRADPAPQAGGKGALPPAGGGPKQPRAKVAAAAPVSQRRREKAPSAVRRLSSDEAAPASNVPEAATEPGMLSAADDDVLLEIFTQLGELTRALALALALALAS